MILVIFLIYMALRSVGFQHSEALEDHDSVNYLREIDMISSHGLGVIFNFNTDSTPFYPSVGAAFALLSDSVEDGARLASLFVSALLFLALLGCARCFLSPVAAAIGLSFVAFNPLLIRMSYSVLSEPTYIALFFCALWVFWAGLRDPTRVWRAATLGVLAGLAFLTRIEGILLAGFFPVIQAIHAGVVRPRVYAAKHLLLWVGVFLVAFSAIAGPQIWRVSAAMGELAINGRQVWSVILAADDGRSYDEKIYGLDYSDSEINVYAAQSDPSVLQDVEARTGPITYLKKAVNNYEELYFEKLGKIIGPAAIVLFGFGALALWLKGRWFDLFLTVAVVCLGVAAPLLHNVVDRHIAVIFPLILLVGGGGVVYLVEALGARHRAALASGLAAVVLAASAVPVARLYFGSDSMRAPDAPDPQEISEMVAMRPVLQAAQANGRKPKVITRKQYFPYYAGAEGLPLPATTYDGLVRYARLNDADFLYLDFGSESATRYIDSFSDPARLADFELVSEGVGARGARTALYRLVPE